MLGHGLAEDFLRVGLGEAAFLCYVCERGFRANGEACGDVKLFYCLEADERVALETLSILPWATI